MTTAITKESLSARIAELESGARSLKEDYTLAAYKMLLATMEAEPVYQVEGTVEKDENGQVTKLEWVDVPYSVAVRAWDEFGLLTRTLYKSPPAKMGAEPVVKKEPVSFDEWSRKCALQVTLCYPDFREKAQYIWDSARETQRPALVVPDEMTADGIIDMHECGYVEGWNACRAAMLNQK